MLLLATINPTKSLDEDIECCFSALTVASARLIVMASNTRRLEGKDPTSNVHAT
jgi:hypothetical protein